MVAGKPVTPFRLYSGHDTGPIIPFLAAYGVWDGQWPTYAAMITLELHQRASGAFAVRLTYNGNVLAVPGCGSDPQGLCDFPTFASISQEIVSYGSTCNVAPAPPSRYR